MEQYWMNLLLFIGILIGAYLIFRYVKFDNVKEGLDNNTSNGVAGNASTFNTQLQSVSTKLSDTLSIKAYRKDYENIILTLDDAISLNMLNTLLTSDPSTLAANAPGYMFYYSSARAGLNHLIKFIDKQ